jgi:hypothetical protein
VTSTTFLLLFLLFAAPPPANLDQVKAEPNAERRARLAIDFAAACEKIAEADYEKGDLNGTGAQLKTMTESVDLAKSSLIASGRTPGRNQKSQEILTRLRDLGQRMDAEEREMIAAPRARIQETHDEWFEGIMGGKR